MILISTDRQTEMTASRRKTYALSNYLEYPKNTFSKKGENCTSVHAW